MYGPPGRRRCWLKRLRITRPAAFIRVVGSEFVQKYLGEGPKNGEGDV